MASEPTDRERLIEAMAGAWVQGMDDRLAYAPTPPLALILALLMAVKETRDGR